MKLDTKSLEMIEQQLHEYKQAHRVLEEFKRMKDEKSCHIIGFTHATLVGRAEHLVVDAEENVEFINYMVEHAIKYYTERLNAKGMLVGLAEMAMKRTLEEHTNGQQSKEV